jgi:hypothetical protein
MTSNNIIYTLQLEQEVTAYMYFTMSAIYRKHDEGSWWTISPRGKLVDY